MPWRKGNRLKLVRESEAQGRVREIYQEVRHALGLPLIPALLQAYGACPAFLELHWRALRPAVQTAGLFQLAQRLRADAYTRMHNYFAVPDLCAQVKDLRLSVGAQQELTDLVELFHYADPLMLLLAATQHQAFENRVGLAQAPTAPAAHPVFPEKPLLVEEEAAPARIKDAYEDLLRTLKLPVLDTAYLALARWPDFFLAYWQALKPITQSPLYAESLIGVRDTAWGLARELPVCVDLTATQLLDAGLKQEEVAAVARITELFLRVLGGLVLNIAVAKIGLEGGSVQPGAAPHAALRGKEPPQAA